MQSRHVFLFPFDFFSGNADFVAEGYNCIFKFEKSV